MGPLPSIGDLADEELCYVTTTGRDSGLPREIEIWFGVVDSTLYILSGNRDRSNWVKNIQRNSNVNIRIGGYIYSGRGRTTMEPHEDATARKLLLEKYQPISKGDLTGWSQASLPIAVDISS